MNKKTCIVTGATSGIGSGIAKGLAKEQVRLILVGRDSKKGDETVSRLKQETGNDDIRFYAIDLASQKQIKEVGEKIKVEFPVIDVLVNNAGIWTSTLELTEDGIEKQFAVNHIAYFLLTHVLYPNLAASKDGRVINMGSDSHRYGRMNFDNYSLKNEYHGLKAYGQSKLANLLFTYEFHRQKRDGHVSVYCISPGLVKTDIGVKHTNPFHAFMWKLRRLGGKTPEQAAETAVYLALSDEAAGQSGYYWEKCKTKPSSVRSHNEEDAHRLWKLSEELCGIKSFFR